MVWNGMRNYSFGLLDMLEIKLTTHKIGFLPTT